MRTERGDRSNSRLLETALCATQAATEPCFAEFGQGTAGLQLARRTLCVSNMTPPERVKRNHYDT